MPLAQQSLQFPKMSRLVFAAHRCAPDVARLRIDRVMIGNHATARIIPSAFKTIKSRKMDIAIFVETEPGQFQRLLSVQRRVHQIASFFLSE